MAFVDVGQGISVQTGDQRLGIRFLYHPFQDHRRSQDEGRPIFTDVEMIEIKIPGSRDVILRAVTENDKYQHAKLYEHFKVHNSELINGTPLSEFPFISASERKELEYFNVYTAEQLVGMADGFIDNMRVNCRDLIKKVKAHLEKATDTAFVTKMTQENENLKREMEVLKQQMGEILALKSEREDAPREKRKVS